MKIGMTIGELAGELRLNPRTIRYYEGLGLLPEPRRNESGYRLYSRDEIERLRLVKRAKLLGLSLGEIKEITDYAMDGRCNVLQERLLLLMEAKLGEIDQKIKDLIAFRDDLHRYHSELTRRLKSQVREEQKAVATASCQCVGQEVDNFRKATKA